MGAKKLFTISLAAVFITKTCKDMEPRNKADRVLGSKLKFNPAEQMNCGSIPGSVVHEHPSNGMNSGPRENIPHTEPEFFVNSPHLERGPLFRFIQLYSFRRSVPAH